MLNIVCYLQGATYASLAWGGRGGRKGALVIRGFEAGHDPHFRSLLREYVAHADFAITALALCNGSSCYIKAAANNVLFRGDMRQCRVSIVLLRSIATRHSNVRWRSATLKNPAVNFAETIKPSVSANEMGGSL